MLVELRLTLLRTLHDTIKEAMDTLRSTETSPADSDFESDDSDTDYTLEVPKLRKLPPPGNVATKNPAVAAPISVGDGTASVQAQEDL